jgi:hypothetical protein
MTVNLQGPIDKPNVGVSGAAFQQNKPSNQGGNPLQQLLGQQQQPQQQQQRQQKKVDPLAPLLQNLLGGQKSP